QVVSRHLDQWRALAGRWQSVVAAARQTTAEVNQQSDELFPAWDDPFWDTWQPTVVQRSGTTAGGFPPPVMRFGSFQAQTQSVVETPPWLEPRAAPKAID